MTVAAADGWSMASAKAIGGHHNRASSGAGMVHSPGSGTMLVGYPLPVASLDAVTVHRHDDVSVALLLRLENVLFLSARTLEVQ